VSRYSEYDDYEGEPEQILAQGRWEHNARVALKGKRGRKALADLREALLALPEKRLIEGAVCTVGAEKRRERWIAEATRAWESMKPEWRIGGPWTDEADNLAELVQHEGEGVCAVGALLWHRKVKAGTDPAEAFASLPDLHDEGSDGLGETADLAKKEAGLTYTLAWELAYRNDETYELKTPEERYTAFLAWIDRELAGTAAAS
jgi:hypothetical protein